MNEENGILTKQEEKAFAKYIDQLIDFSKLNGFVWNLVELLDGNLFQGGISYLDDKFGEKLPAGLKEEAQLFIKSVMSNDIEKVIQHGTHLINKLVDVPYLTEDNEAIIIGTLLEGLIKVILNEFHKSDS